MTFDDIKSVVGILALVGAWYGVYRIFATNSASYLEAHNAVNEKILAKATACAEEATKYVVMDPRGGYNLTDYGRLADQHEIEAYRQRLIALMDEIQNSLDKSPNPWRFRYAARWQFINDVRRWLKIKGVCRNIARMLSGDRSPAK